MNMKKLAFDTLNFLTILVIVTFCVFGQQKVSGLKDKKITLIADKEPLGVVFRQLMQTYNLAIGFEESILDQEHNDYMFETNLKYIDNEKSRTANGSLSTPQSKMKPQISTMIQRSFIVKENFITVNAENESLEAVLNIIIGQMENYEWEINDEVINIFPIKGRDKRLQKLLESNINQFTISKGMKLKEIRNKLFALPEFKLFSSENTIYVNYSRVLYFGISERELPAEIIFSNLSFRDLLNKISKVKRGGWILKIFRDQNSKVKEYIDLNI